jgi:hypothetical protein
MISMFLLKSAADLTQAFRERVLLQEFWNILRFRLVQYLGTWRGYRYSGKIDQKLHKQFYYPPGSLTEKIPATRPVEPIRYTEEEG